MVNSQGCSQDRGALNSRDRCPVPQNSNRFAIVSILTPQERRILRGKIAWTVLEMRVRFQLHRYDVVDATALCGHEVGKT